MLHKRFSGNDWYTGVGIVPDGSGLGLRLTASSRPDPAEVPKTYYGFNVKVVVTRGYTAR